MLKLLLADPRDIAKLSRRGRARRRDTVDGCIMQHDIGRDTARSRHFRTPRPERADQRGVARFALASGYSDIAAPGFGPAGAAWGLLAQHYFGLAFQDAARGLRQF